jgi:hypothetical protein
MMGSERLNLGPEEHDLFGQWVVTGGRVEADAVCTRIERLTSGVLERLAVSRDGWGTLFRDLTDGRLWERTYPASGMHGGGPPRLHVLEESDAVAKYPRPWGAASTER